MQLYEALSVPSSYQRIDTSPSNEAFMHLGIRLDPVEPLAVLAPEPVRIGQRFAVEPEIILFADLADIRVGFGRDHAAVGHRRPPPIAAHRLRQICRIPGDPAISARPGPWAGPSRPAQRDASLVPASSVSRGRSRIDRILVVDLRDPVLAQAVERAVDMRPGQAQRIGQMLPPQRKRTGARVDFGAGRLPLIEAQHQIGDPADRVGTADHGQQLVDAGRLGRRVPGQPHRQIGLAAKCLADKPGIDRADLQRRQAAYRMIENAEQGRLQSDDLTGHQEVEYLPAAIAAVAEAIGPSGSDSVQDDPDLALVDQQPVRRQ